MKCGENRQDIEYVLSLSYGKDSIATIEACKQLGQRIDRIVHAEVWATQDIPAELPPMVEFKKKADKIIFERYGISVERVCAKKGNVGVFDKPCEWEDKLSYADGFYMPIKKSRYENAYNIYGFPMQKGSWCKKLKYGRWLDEENLRGRILQNIQAQQGQNIRLSDDTRELVYRRTQNECDEGGCHPNTIQILGIAVDEPKRIERHKEKALLPLVEIGWTEAYCRKWCEENDLLSPTYTTSLRGGCWFCHNQGVQQLRLLRRDYPELWAILMEWDNDSPVSFKPDGRSVHDFDKRFQLEDEGLIDERETFRWQNVEYPQMRINWEV